MNKSYLKRKILEDILKNQEYRRCANELKRKIYFNGQNPDEVIFAKLRSSYIRNISWLIEILFLFVLPILLPELINFMNSLNVIIIEKTFLSYTVIFVAYYSILLTFFVYKFLDWYLDIYLVTSQRLIEIVFRPYGDIYTKEIWLGDIDTIKTSSSGLLGLILNYGDIKIITRTESGGAELKYISNFNKVKNLISDLSKISKKYEN